MVLGNTDQQMIMRFNNNQAVTMNTQLESSRTIHSGAADNLLPTSDVSHTSRGNKKKYSEQKDIAKQIPENNQRKSWSKIQDYAVKYFYCDNPISHCVFTDSVEEQMESLMPCGISKELIDSHRAIDAEKQCVSLNINETAEDLPVFLCRRGQQNDLLQLHEAVANNNGYALKEYKGSLYINGKRFCGTLLHFAAYYGRIDVAKALLKQEANINRLSSSHSWTPLHTVISSPAFDKQDNERHCSKTRMVQFLLQNNADITIGHPIIEAIKEGETDIIEILIQSSVSVNQYYPIPGFEKIVMTPLFIATLYGQLETTTVLLEYGADVNAGAVYCHPNKKTTESIASPLFAAISEGHTKLVDLLLTHKAQIETSLYKINDHGIPEQNTTPLHVACERNQIEYVDKLLKNNPEVVNYPLQHIPAIIYAIKGKSLESLLLLLKTNASLEFIPKLRATPLQYALQIWPNEEAIKHLILFGTDIESIDSNGLTPLLNAVKLNLKNIVKMLIANGADINATCNNRNSVLHHAFTDYQHTK